MKRIKTQTLTDLKSAFQFVLQSKWKKVGEVIVIDITDPLVLGFLILLNATYIGTIHSYCFRDRYLAALLIPVFQKELANGQKVDNSSIRRAIRTTKNNKRQFVHHYYLEPNTFLCNRCSIFLKY